MSLYARITATDSTKVATHMLSAAFGLWANGRISRADALAASEIAGNASSEADVDAMAAVYSGFGTNTTGHLNKLNYLRDVEHANIAAEMGKVTEAQWRVLCRI